MESSLQHGGGRRVSLDEKEVGQLVGIGRQVVEFPIAGLPLDVFPSRRSDGVPSGTGKAPRGGVAQLDLIRVLVTSREDGDRIVDPPFGLEALPPVGGRGALEQWKQRPTILGNRCGAASDIKESRREVAVEPHLVHDPSLRHAWTANDEGNPQVFLVGKVFSLETPVLSQVKA